MELRNLVRVIREFLFHFNGTKEMDRFHRAAGASGRGIHGLPGQDCGAPFTSRRWPDGRFQETPRFSLDTGRLVGGGTISRRTFAGEGGRISPEYSRRQDHSADAVREPAYGRGLSRGADPLALS